MRIAVAGGTGLVGTLVVEALIREGHTPVVLARARGVDLTTGDGLAQAIDGADAVIDVTNVVTTGRRKSVGFFEAVTANLLAAGHQARVQHHVALSIVGVDRVRFGYYDGKLRQEQLVREGAVPSTILRATQFHEFAGQMLERVPGPVAVLPRQLIQPVAAREVAEELVAVAVGEPQGLARELAGPEKHELVDLARRLLEATGQRRRVVGMRMPGKGGRAMASGGLLPATGAHHGTQTFEDWLGGVTV